MTRFGRAARCSMFDLGAGQRQNPAHTHTQSRRHDRSPKTRSRNLNFKQEHEVLDMRKSRNTIGICNIRLEHSSYNDCQVAKQSK